MKDQRKAENTTMLNKLSSQALNKALNIARVGCWEWSIEDGSEIWSDEQFRIFGYEPGEVEPTHNLFVEAVHPGDQDRVLRSVESVLAGAEPHKIEFRINCPDKSERTVISEGEVIRDNRNNPVKIIGTVVDITAHKTSHAQIRELHARTDALIYCHSRNACV